MRLWTAVAQRRSEALTQLVAPALIIAVALLFLWLGLRDVGYRDVHFNLFSEFVGILLTVYGVDLFNRRRHHRERLRERARHYIMEIFRCTWIWLGGDKSVSLSAYRDRLSKVTDECTLEPHTLRSLRNLGWHALHEASLHKDGQRAESLISALRALETVWLEDDLDPGAISKQLDAALAALERVVPGEFERATSERGVAMDCSIQSQSERCQWLGNVHDTQHHVIG